VIRIEFIKLRGFVFRESAAAAVYDCRNPFHDASNPGGNRPPPQGHGAPG
jgi:hypothetical protein